MSGTRMIEEINNAIYAHGAWKLQLRTAITKGSSNMAPATVRCDDQCAFGRWLYGSTLSAETRDAMPYKVVKRLHAEFHTCAGTVLEHALAKRTDTASSLLSGEFNDRSQVLLVALAKWKQELATQKVA